MKTVARALAGIITAGVLTVVGVIPAEAAQSATTAPPATMVRGGESELLASFLSASGISRGDSDKVLAAFAAMSTERRGAVVRTLEGGRPTDIVQLGVATTSVVRSAAPAAPGAPAAARLAMSAASATYEVTANFKQPISVFGITVGSYNIRYRYQTGRGVVLSDRSCEAWHSGSAGYWTVSNTTSNWVAAGRGNCVAVFTGSLFFKGSNVTENREMGMITDGVGIFNEWCLGI